MNFLDSASAPSAAPKKDDDKKPSAQDLSFHVPQPATPAPAPKPLPHPIIAAPVPKKDDVKKQEDLLASKFPTSTLKEPVLPLVKAAPVPSGGPAPKTVPKAPPIAAANGAMPPGRDTLRVSLISAGGGVGLSELTVRERLRKFWQFAILAILLDAAIFGSILWYRNVIEQRVIGIQQSLVSLDAQVAQAEADAKSAKDLQTLLRSADQALKQHKHWTTVLSMLEGLIKPQVVLSAVTLSDQGTLTSSITAPDYLTIAQQILVFRNDPRIKSVPFTGASKGGNAASTGLTIQFNPAVLLDDASATPAL